MKVEYVIYFDYLFAKTIPAHLYFLVLSLAFDE